MIIAGLYAGDLLLQSWLGKALFGVAIGVMIARLFVIGHDACHGSFTRSKRANATIARVAFLPALMPAGPWSLGHNQLHHGFTNLREWDYAWAPFSFSEWTVLPKWRQLVERFYRSFCGLGSYYLFEIWLRHMIYPCSETRKRWRPKFWVDVCLVYVFAILIGVLTIVVACDTKQSISLVILCAIVVPFLTWSVLVGFVIYLQHTNYQVAWRRGDNTQRPSSIQATMHVSFPRWFSMLFHNVMDHVAHHVDPLIPVYVLRQAERELMDKMPGINVSSFSIAELISTIRACKLYDYDSHTWLDFSGRPSVFKSDKCARTES